MYVCRTRPSQSTREFKGTSGQSPDELARKIWSSIASSRQDQPVNPATSARNVSSVEHYKKSGIRFCVAFEMTPCHEKATSCV
jgi:hypothetical protein